MAKRKHKRRLRAQMLRTLKHRIIPAFLHSYIDRILAEKVS